MLRKFSFVLMCFSLAATLACSRAETSNSNARTANQIDPANMPPGLSTNAITPSANTTPGISVNGNKIPAGNIPGIPDPSTIGKTPQPKNTPPIPGIPDQETLKKQMNTPIKDTNMVNNPPKNQSNANNRPPDKRGNRNQ